MFEKKNNNNLVKILTGTCIILTSLLIIMTALYLKKEGKDINLKDKSSEVCIDGDNSCSKDNSKVYTEKTEEKKELNNGNEPNKETKDLNLNKGDNKELKDKKTGNLDITIIEAKPDIDVNSYLKQLKQQIPTIAESNSIVIKDLKDKGIKEYLKENNIKYLPAIIFSNKDFDGKKDPQDLKPFLAELPNGQYSLEIGASYDPFPENCSNGIDDNEDGKIDCKDEKCNKDLACAENCSNGIDDNKDDKIDCEDKKCSKTIECSPKVEKPKAELFIMSYCPYGTQSQKGFLEAMMKLDKFADMKIKFVYYLMHGEEEGKENIVQYCLQEEQNDKFKDYLKCFLADGNSKNCIDTLKIDSSKLKTCVDRTKKDINYDKNISDKTRRFPIFSLNKDDNEKYGVQGSPTFVLNGIKIENTGRSAKAYADLICSTFKEKPKICNEEFNDITYDPGFGFKSNGNAVSGGCGG